MPTHRTSSSPFSGNIHSINDLNEKWRQPWTPSPTFTHTSDQTIPHASHSTWYMIKTSNTHIHHKTTNTKLSPCHIKRKANKSKSDNSFSSPSIKIVNQHDTNATFEPQYQHTNSPNHISWRSIYNLTPSKTQSQWNIKDILRLKRKHTTQLLLITPFKP